MKDFLVIPVSIPHLGCPHKCVFCNQKRITGKITGVTPSDIRDTVEFFLKFRKGKEVVEVAFFGGTFTGLPSFLQEEFLEVVRPYIEKGYVHHIRLSTRPDYIDNNILSFLKNYGVRVIELGVQSLIDNVLQLSQRGHNVEDVEKASRLIKESGFLLAHQIMPGLPGDTRETVLKTVRKSIKMKPDMVRIYPTLVLKDTELYNMYKSGEYKPLSLRETIYLVSISYLYYTAHNIKIIRVGLQTTEEINEKNIVAGPYHPSIGELIKSQVYLWMVLYFLKIIEDGSSSLTLYANRKTMSYLAGYRGWNFKEIGKLFPDFSKAVDDSLSDGELFLKKGNKKCKISLVEFSKKVYKNIINKDELEVVYEYI